MINNKKDIDDIDKKINEDLIVRNMPALHQTFKKKKFKQPQFNNSNNTKAIDSNKKIGVVIIFSGFVLVIILVYLAYRYIINPNTIKKVNVNNIENNKAPVSSPVSVKKDSQEQNKNKIKEDALYKNKTKEDTLDLIKINEVNTIKNTDESKTKEKSVVVGSSQVKQKTNPVVIADSDHDGLNDDEEMLFGTNFSMMDSDNDGYNDLSEIQHGYNPIGSGSLIESGTIKEYFNKQLSYITVVPSSWKVNSINDGNTVTFSSADNTIIQIFVQGNPGVQNIVSWYEKTFPNATITYDMIKNTDTWDGLFGPEHLNFYLTDKERKNIYIISYISPVEEQMVYNNLFDLIVNSFEIK